MSLKNFATAVVLVVSGCALAPALASAQSLGDVAKKETERRQVAKPASKVITNTDLPNVPPPSSPPPAPAPVAVTASDASTGGTATVDGKPAPGKDDKDGKDDKPEAKDQKYWAGRMKTLQDDQSRDKLFADSLQSRINGLTIDFVNRDDPYQRDKIAKDRDNATKELDRVKKAIVDRTKSIADLEDEARRAGVPAGWLR